MFPRLLGPMKKEVMATLCAAEFSVLRCSPKGGGCHVMTRKQESSCPLSYYYLLHVQGCFLVNMFNTLCITCSLAEDGVSSSWEFSCEKLLPFYCTLKQFIAKQINKEIYVFVCIYICMYICMYIYIYIHTHKHTHNFIYL